MLRVTKADPHVYAVGYGASFPRPAAYIILNAIPVLGASIKRARGEGEECGRSVMGLVARDVRCEERRRAT